MSTLVRNAFRSGMFTACFVAAIGRDASGNPPTTAAADSTVKAAEIAAQAQQASSRMVFVASILSAAIAAFGAAIAFVTWRTTRAFNERTAALQENAEERLKLETFISALPLLNGTIQT